MLNSLPIAMKIMKFCAPGNDPQRFHWSHMTCEKLNLMTLALNNDVELKPNNIANFWKTAKTMVREGKCTDNIDAETILRLDMAEIRLSAANSKNIAREASEQRADEAYHLTEDKEFQFYLTMETFDDKVRNMCRPVFDNAWVKKPTDRELALVNNMFAFYNMIQGNRPGVYRMYAWTV